MGKFIDLTGTKYGRLTIVKRIENKGRNVMWECICECGNHTTASTSNLRRGNVKSCGCLWKESITTHGHSKGGGQSTEYNSWINLVKRCCDINTTDYDIYGGRGIEVCDRWKNSFDNFLEDMGLKPDKKMSIDRIDPDGDYEPSNCRWVTVQQNNFNLRARRGTSSKYKGVSWYKASKRWSAYIGKDNIKIHLGYFDTEIEAAKAYNEAANEHFGEYAHLNIIE